ncbi:hypothetical protein M422DRAFT_785289 [Sphaerobolus stellatus SS14]|uniref:Ornithine aminotransferase n=1 Tax=Sphaerobolus stellatus (strain SS14) TaxID=990650 RepID=A0A0C9TWQ6_SPHS4|nr:hypothetical protein M422DRAFT_785289 [Sphaerobolus stellatus SS14]
MSADVASTVPNPSTLQNPNHDTLKVADQSHQMHGFSHPSMQKSPVIFQSGDGGILKDVDGTEYIDLLGGITVSNLGHGREDIARIAYDQIRTLEIGNAYPGYFDGARVYLTAGGAEGVEAGELSEWHYGSSTRGYWKKKLIGFRSCYHGSTFVPFSLMTEFYDYGWDRLTEGWSTEMKQHKDLHFFSSNDPPNEMFFNKDKIKQGENVGQAAARLLEEHILDEGPDSVAAFIFEPVQGDGGAVPHHPDFFPLARQICDKHKVLMIADEIMAFAKTGTWFGMQQYNVAPDIMIISKALTSGYLPMGAVIYTDRHDYTWSGHPTCAAVALKVLEIIVRDDMISKAAERGRTYLSILQKKLHGLRLVKDIRGRGLMLGIDLISDIGSDVGMRLLLEKKVVLKSSSNQHCLLMTPPAVLTDEQFEKAADGIKDVLSSWQARGENLVSKSRQS